MYTASRTPHACRTHSPRLQVLEWCEHHRKDPEPLPEDADDSRKKSTEIPDWDKKFIDVDQEMLFEIILAANYLDIKPCRSSLGGLIALVGRGFVDCTDWNIACIYTVLEIGCKTVVCS